MSKFLYPLFFLSVCYLNYIRCSLVINLEKLEISLPEDFDGDHDHFQVLKAHMRNNGWKIAFITQSLIINGGPFGRKDCGAIYCSLEPVIENKIVKVEELNFLNQIVKTGETPEQIKKRLIVRSMFYSDLPILIDRVIVNGKSIGSFELK